MCLKQYEPDNSFQISIYSDDMEQVCQMQLNLIFIYY